jgi:hypothetical protein
MIEMLQTFERIIKGKQWVIDKNIKKYGLKPCEIIMFWKDHKEIIFVTTHGNIFLRKNRDSADICEYFSNSSMFIWVENRYINIDFIKTTRRYFAKKPFRLIIHLKNGTKIKLSENYQMHSLKHLNDRIRSKLNEMK